MPAQNLDDVLSFISEMFRKDEKQVYQIADYTAGLHYHEADLHGMVGLEFNTIGPNGRACWLKIDRLVKEPRPKFPRSRDNEVAGGEARWVTERWITAPDDPNGRPQLKNSLRLLLPKIEAQKLVRYGRSNANDVGRPDATGRVMTTLSLQRFPEISAMYDDWLQSSWLPWTERERPRRKSIAFYDELFKIHSAISGRDAALEVIMGVGEVRGRIAGHDVDHPLLEYPAEITVHPGTASITVSAREDSCEMFSFPAEDGAGAAALTATARRHWAELPDSCDISPFERLHWEPVLQAAASYLGSAGQYVSLSLPRNLRVVSTGFSVFDSWVLIVRPSSLKPLLADIAAMQDELRRAERLDPLIVLLDDPSKAENLLQDMADRGADLVRAATGCVSVHPGSTSGPSQRTVTVAPYFPKLSNQDQEKIIRILERKESKGLVVQGPPGTGKSHSIANILCHGMACGWRVLVAAHSDGPLQVLKGMLPKELKSLAINLAASEQSEVDQLEESVKAIASIATKVDDRDAHVRRIEQTEERIVANRVRLVEISEAFLKWARENLDYLEAYGGRMTAASLAEIIVRQNRTNAWFDDTIPIAHLTPPLGEPEIGRLRALRARLGSDLLAYTWRIPEDGVIPPENEIVHIHSALVECKSLARFNPKVAIQHLAGLDNGRALAAALRDRLVAIGDSLDTFRACSWLEIWVEDSRRRTEQRRVATAISEILDSVAPLIAKEMDFVLSQVVVPSIPPGMKQAVQKASLSDKPYSRVPLLRPSDAIMRALDAVRVRGRPPKKETWKIIGEYIDWLEAVDVAASRWNALAQMFSLESCPADPHSGLTWFKSALDSIKTAKDFGDRLVFDLQPDTILFNPKGISPGQIKTARSALDSTHNLLQDWRDALTHRISQLDVAWASARHAEIVRALNVYTGPASEQLKGVIANLGNETMSEEALAKSWREVLASIAVARSQVLMGREIEELADRLAMAGAEKWAFRLKTVPNNSAISELSNMDSVIPTDWQEAWVWSAWKGKLEANRSLARIEKLFAEKTALDEQIGKLMKSVILLRTELQLSRLPKPLITKLTLFQSAVQRIGAGTGVRAARLRKEAKRLAAECYDAVPCWIMPIKKVAETQPPKLGIFDLVIIDEASQCGPEAIPVMMRGKKALIVGDDKQVSPTSFMSEESYLQLHARFLADSPYRSALSPGASMYNLASAMFAGGNIRLREHFRCVEPIIRFSMRFYGEDTNTSLIPLRIPKASERLDPPLIDVFVPHGTAHGKTNHAEAVVITNLIGEIARDQAYERKTIGVISLNGAEQAALIEREIMNQLGPEVFSKFELLVADSSGFQGKERSIMLLSMVDAPNRRTTARIQDVYTQRYNVALSRARDRMYLIHSLPLESLKNPKDMRRQTLQHFSDPMPTEVARRQATEDLMSRCDSNFERDVLSRLLRDGFDANPQFPAAGYKIDIVVEGEDDRRLAIELDGDVYHPPEQYAKEMERQQQLERIGFKFWRCWWSEWILDPDSCYADLLNRLDSLGVKPLVGVRKPRNNYAASFVADTDGKLMTPEEYRAKVRAGRDEDTEESEGEHAGSSDRTDVPGDSGASAKGDHQVVAFPTPRAAIARSNLSPGDMIVVQTTAVEGDDECRTRNLEIRSGDQDDFAAGKVGVNSSLGRALGACSVDDCFEHMIEGRGVAITVIAIRRAA